jgi:hypothetical protein
MKGTFLQKVKIFHVEKKNWLHRKCGGRGGTFSSHIYTGRERFLLTTQKNPRFFRSLLNLSWESFAALSLTFYVMTTIP